MNGQFSANPGALYTIPRAVDLARASVRAVLRLAYACRSVWSGLGWWSFRGRPNPVHKGQFEILYQRFGPTRCISVYVGRLKKFGSLYLEAASRTQSEPSFERQKRVSYSRDSSKGVSSKFGPPTREAKSSGLPSSPLNILHLRDTDSDGDDDVVQDNLDDDYFDGPSEKRRKISPHEYSPHLVPDDLVDPVGEPLFDPTSIHHPNSS
ncbi:hypothetical protein NDU88_003466 [Pleurodeles waltl]|uniref:Uncharacterized protein n=1 Tax=Pleurodeles waltl TaxID=8319 RepID=A0AAV7KVM7_PLEWA|nr:hypothetical protein NDU88_003466 [Pleurodeles waltl]